MHPAQQVPSRELLAEPVSCPFNILPAEIVGVVFEELLASLCDPRDKYRLPALLMSVCRHWNETVVETPGLWTHVRINTPPHDPLSELRNYDTLFSPISTRLRRSGALPLSIQGSVTDRDGFILLELVGEESHRWRSVNLHFTTDGPLPYLPRRTPLLEEMILVGPKLHWSCRPPRLPIPEAPKLRIVSLTYILRPDCAPALAGLTELRLADIISVDLRDHALWALLSASPFLATLHLKGMAIRRSNESAAGNVEIASPKRLVLNELRELRLLDMKCEEMSLILSLFEAQNLKRLELEELNQPSSVWKTSNLETYLNFPQLERLVIGKMPSHDCLLEDLSRLTSSITCLAILMQNTFKAIRDLTRSPPLFPHLHTLTAKGIPPSALLECVSTRRSMPHVLRRINIHISDMGLQVPTGDINSGLPPPLSEFEETVAKLRRSVRVEIYGQLSRYQRSIYGSWDAAMKEERITNGAATIFTDDLLSDAFNTI